MDKVQSIRNLSLIIKTVFMERKLFKTYIISFGFTEFAYATTIEYIVKRTLSTSPFVIKTFACDNLLFNATLVSIYEHIVALNGQGSIYS